MEVVPLDEQHVEVEQAVDLAEIVHRDDVRFLQARPRYATRACAETLLEAGVGRHLDERAV